MTRGQTIRFIVIEILLPNVDLLADWGNVKRRTYRFAASFALEEFKCLLRFLLNNMVARLMS